jgi:hypothetical protein
MLFNIKADRGALVTSSVVPDNYSGVPIGSCLSAERMKSARSTASATMGVPSMAGQDAYQLRRKVNLVMARSVAVRPRSTASTWWIPQGVVVP